MLGRVTLPGAAELFRPIGTASPGVIRAEGLSSSGRIVRASIAIALEGVASSGAESDLARRLPG